MKLRTALTIAGSDCSGGAGIQADIKAMTMNGVYAMSVITALTAQNTTGVAAIHEVPPDFVAQQIDMVFDDIRPDAVKIGMAPNPGIIGAIATALIGHGAKNIVVDPVMVASSGSSLIKSNAVEALKHRLLPAARLVTPNIPEAEVLSGMNIHGPEHMEKAAAIIYSRYGCAVLVKGGHSVSDANDLLCENGSFTWFGGRRIDNPNTHGTGCTLSSTIAANLALGHGLDKSICLAKDYISGALGAMLDLGRGSGPMDHAYRLRKM